MKEKIIITISTLATRSYQSIGHYIAVYWLVLARPEKHRRRARQQQEEQTDGIFLLLHTVLSGI